MTRRKVTHMIKNDPHLEIIPKRTRNLITLIKKAEIEEDWEEAFTLTMKIVDLMQNTNDPDRERPHLTKACLYADKLNDPKLRYQAHSAMGNAYVDNGEYIKGLKHLNIAMENALEPDQKAKAHMALGLYNWEMADIRPADSEMYYDQARMEFKLAIQWANGVPRPQRDDSVYQILSSCFTNLGILATMREELNKTDELLTQAEQHAGKIVDQDTLSDALLSLYDARAEWSCKSGNHEAELKFLQKGLPYHVGVSMKQCLMRMGEAQLHLNNYREAEKIFLKLIKDYQAESESQDVTDEAESGLELARSKIACMENIPKLNKKLSDARRLENFKEQVEILVQLGDSYFKLDKFRDALDNYESCLDLMTKYRIGLEHMRYLRPQTARCYASLGRNVDAAKLFRTSLREANLTVQEKGELLADLNATLLKVEGEPYESVMQTIDEQLECGRRSDDLDLQRRGLLFAIALHKKYNLRFKEIQDQLRELEEALEVQASDDVSPNPESSEPPSAQPEPILLDSTPPKSLQEPSSRLDSSPIQSQLKRRRLKRPLVLDSSSSQMQESVEPFNLDSPPPKSPLVRHSPIMSNSPPRRLSTPKMSDDEMELPPLDIRSRRADLVFPTSRSASPMQQFRVRVKFDKVPGLTCQTILVPIHHSQIDSNEKTLEWLLKEAKERLKSLYPKLNLNRKFLLKTEDDALLYPKDLVLETVEDNQQIVAMIQ